MKADVVMNRESWKGGNFGNGREETLVTNAKIDLGRILFGKQWSRLMGIGT